VRLVSYLKNKPKINFVNNKRV